MCIDDALVLPHTARMLENTSANSTNKKKEGKYGICGCGEYALLPNAETN